MSDVTLGAWNELRRRTGDGGLGRQSGASARFLSDEELLASPRWRYQAGDATLLLGHRQGSLVGLAHDDRHALVCAATRGGKGVSLVVPWLVSWPSSGSIVCLDPKGELARMTARARRELHGQKVVVLDPFGISGQPQGCLNLLDAIDLASPRVVADLQLLMEALIVSSHSQTDSDHWTGAARELVLALCLYAKIYFHRPTVVDVYDLLSGKHGSVAGSLDHPSDVLGVMMESDTLNGALRAMGLKFLEIADKEQASIISTARRQLAWLEGLNNADAAMTRVCQSSDFTLADLKRERVALFICLPAGDLVTYRGFMRAVVTMAMNAIEHTPSPPGAAPVLVLLDEFPILGRLETLEKAVGLLAGSGCKIVPIIQDISQLRAVYGERWPSFVANAGVSVWFAPGGDEPTLNYIAQRLGKTQYYETQQPSGAFMDCARAGMLHTPGGQWVTAPLLYQHEIEQSFARESGHLLALAAGSPPAILDRVDIRQGFLREWVDA